MSNLFVRTYTFTDGTTAYGSQVESEIANIVNILNNLNTATTNWGQVSSLNAISVPLIADNSAGTQHIADFKNNSVIKASISSTGLITGDTISTKSITFTSTSGVIGTTTNNNAAAGSVGEYIESVVTTPDTNFPTSTQFGDDTSIALTAGDWELTACFTAAGNGATWSAVYIGISTTSGNSATGLSLGVNYFREIWASSSSTPATVSLMVPSYRLSLSGSATAYLKFQSTYTGGPPATQGCRLSARRMR